MNGEQDDRIDTLLIRLRSGEPGAAGEAVERYFPRLRELAEMILANERPGHTHSPTALVNEIYLKLDRQLPPSADNPRHLMALIAMRMRHELIDHARKRNARKRAENKSIEFRHLEPGTVELFPRDRIEELEAQMEKLRSSNERFAEVVHLRYYAGLTIEQTARLMGVSPALVKKDWKIARVWLRSQMNLPE